MKRFRREEGGFTVVWIATMLTVLLGFSAFGVDLGWLYLNAVRAQTAVDAAALAGVVNLPSFPYEPDAMDAAQANGFDPYGSDTMEFEVLADNELKVSLSTEVEPFFLRVLGFSSFTVTREATAQYVKPIPLGSPSNCFGWQPSFVTGCQGEEDFWAAVSGQRTRLQDGDPYSTHCDGVNSSRNCVGANPIVDRTKNGVPGYEGYYFAVEVFETTSNLSIRLWDPGYDERGLQVQTGDGHYSPGGGPDIDLTFTLYPPDTTPLIPDDQSPGEAVCAESSNGTANEIWSYDTLCGTIANPIEGIYTVHVMSTTNSVGSNNFSIWADSSGQLPRVYGINDMSIWNNNFTSGSELYLAEIGPEHAGKKLQLSFYDAGDANDQSFYSVLEPDGSVADCSWRVYEADGVTPHTPSLDSSGVQSCTWETQVNNPGTSQGIYNKLWIVAFIDLPDDPADMCDGSDCFWKVDLDLSEPTERTTWTAKVIGNPVRLLP